MQSSADLAESFTEDDIATWLGEAEIAKGRPYVDLIHDFSITDGEMEAAVPGSARQPYRVEALIAPSVRQAVLVARCSCPVGKRCKHIAAVLLKAIELGVDLKKSSPEVKEVLDALKALEKQGYSYEAADASFRILVQKVLRKHKPFFELEGFRVIIEKGGKDMPGFKDSVNADQMRELVAYLKTL